MLRIYTRFQTARRWFEVASYFSQLGYPCSKPSLKWYRFFSLNQVAKERLSDNPSVLQIAKRNFSVTCNINQKESEGYISNSLQSDREKYFVKKVKPLSDKEREKLRYLLREYVLDNPSYIEKALEIGISKEIYPRALRLFRKHVHEATGRKELYTQEDVELYNVVVKTLYQENDAMALEVLFPSFVEYTKKYFPEEIQVRNRMREYADLRLPQLLFPHARKRKRKIIYHFGPTNSGKTYYAMERLKFARNGVYAGPLRLLAWEAFEKMNADGVFTNLMTGEVHSKTVFIIVF